MLAFSSVFVYNCLPIEQKIYFCIMRARQTGLCSFCFPKRYPKPIAINPGQKLLDSQILPPYF